MEFKKIKRIIAKSNNHKTETQIETSSRVGTRTFISNNPMKRPEVIEKMRVISSKTKHPEMTLRNLINNPSKNGSGFKGKHHTKEAKEKMRIHKLGLPNNQNIHKEWEKYVAEHGHPMKNPIYVEKWEAWLKTTMLSFDDETFNKIVEEFNLGVSLTQLAKVYGVDRGSLSKLFKRKGIKFTRGERIGLYNKMRVLKGGVENEKDNTVIPAITIN